MAALLAVLERPGIFGRLLLESPSLYVGNRFLLRKARRAPRWPARVYLGVGTAETSKPDINRETVENVRVLESILQGAGLGPEAIEAGRPGGRDALGRSLGRPPAARRWRFFSAGERRAFPTFLRRVPSNRP